MKRIGILTSGGDAPGMNAAIRAVVRAAMYYDIIPYGIYDGYKGLVEGNIERLGRFSDCINIGGTKLGTSRLPEFTDVAVREKAIENMRTFGLEALIVIGGDGSYRGARDLVDMGVNCICLPGTIDNDIASTDFTIGFDTALNTILDAIDKLRDTSSSHQRCSIIEVMGRRCGDLAVYAAVCGGAEVVITSETEFDKPRVLKYLQDCYNAGKRHAIVVITEKITDVHEFACEVEENTGFNSRATVLGHVQRGGYPSAKDRVLASSLGVYAVDLLVQGFKGQCVGLINNKLAHTEIHEALEMKRTKSYLYDISAKLS